MSRGFTQSVIEAINEADPTHIGVKLGKLMIKGRVSVIEVSSILGLSRNSVHMLIKGQRWPRRDAAARVEQLIAELQSRLA